MSKSRSMKYFGRKKLKSYIFEKFRLINRKKVEVNVNDVSFVSNLHISKPVCYLSFDEMDET